MMTKKKTFKQIFKKIFKKIFTVAFLFLAAGSAQGAETAICYNCPPEWAGWGNQLQLIKDETGIIVPLDNKNSGQSVSQLIAEQKNPVADVCYLGVSFAINARKAGVIEAYKPKGWEAVPEGLKDPDGYWVSIHSGTMGFMVNVEALEGKPIPRSWKDLLDPEYRGMVGFLDPTSAFVGYVGAVAANHALGGTLDNFDPGIAYFNELQKNAPIVPKQTAYARVLSGEIPILLDYDFNAYRAKHTDKANVEFIIPAEGTIMVPYVMTFVKGAPHAKAGQEVIDFVLGVKGQRLWAENFLRPVMPGVMTPEIAGLFLPESEYARAGSVNYGKMAEVQQAFGERYLKDVVSQ
ncbi:MAG: ABC transporter substrate-binding protein [Deltaproteobacteria bacterium]|jgi:putative spermidine/putrescine transport system substrate-binding protein|nr:ABC transporter substrate-binding protein [Deltaproteobacteria bacterium]